MNIYTTESFYFYLGILCFEYMIRNSCLIYILCLSGICMLYKYAIWLKWRSFILIYLSYFSLNAFNKSLLSLNDCDSNQSNLSLVQRIRGLGSFKFKPMYNTS